MLGIIVVFYLTSEVSSFLLLSIVWLFLDGVQMRVEDLLEQIKGEVWLRLAEYVLVVEKQLELVDRVRLSLFH